MPTQRPFTWKQVAEDYPEFMAWIRTQTPENLAGPVNVDQYNQFKANYGAYLEQQMQAMQQAPNPDA